MWADMIHYNPDLSYSKIYSFIFSLIRIIFHALHFLSGTRGSLMP